MEKRKSISFFLHLSTAILIAAAGIAVDLVTLQASKARLLDHLMYGLQQAVLKLGS